MAHDVYILASKPNGTLYVGVTHDLVRRVHEHKRGLAEGFTKRYRVKLLVYFEVYDSAVTAFQREKNIKHWKRDWKIALIERDNPHWSDLFERICR